MTTTVQRLARWAGRLSLTEVPTHVRELARTQRRSVFGAIAAADALPQVQRAVASGGRDLTGATRAVHTATVASIALDFDDYVCFAHTGHSAVVVPIVVGDEVGATGEDQLAAQVAAGEIGARLGGACLLGPLNGQLWSFVHAAIAAVAAGRLLGLGPDRLAHALALALHQPPRPTPGGFVGTGAKLLTAAEPALAGLRAAHLASDGMDGPVDVLDRPDGFFAAFAEVALRGLLGGLGRGWALTTLSVKTVPGCAYIGAAVDALDRLGSVRPDDVAEIAVRASPPTVLMEALAAPYAPPGTSTGSAAETSTATTINPVTVTFSVRWTLAVLVLAGDLAPERFTVPWLESNHSRLRDLAGRVHVTSDRDLTVASAAAFIRVLPPRRVIDEAGITGLASALRRRSPGLGAGTPARPGRSLTAIDSHRRRAPGRSPQGEVTRPTTERPGLLTLLRRGAQRYDYWDPRQLSGFRMVLPAELMVTTHDGRQQSARVDVPSGGAGHGTTPPAVAAAAKLDRYGVRCWDRDGTEELSRAIAADAATLAEYFTVTVA